MTSAVIAVMAIEQTGDQSMAPAPERQTANESRAATTEVAADDDGSADTTSTDDGSADAAASDEKPANGIPAWLAGGMAVGGEDTFENRPGFLTRFFRTA